MLVRFTRNIIKTVSTFIKRTMTQNDNLVPEWNIFKSEYIVASLHPSPCTTGVTLIESKNKSILDIFALPVQEFMQVMIHVQRVSNILCDRLNVQRCALITEPQDKKPTKILLIPLHGLSDIWKPCICPEPEFHSCYPGYCSSKNGPKASDDDLREIQNKIRKKLRSQDISFNFYGNPDNNNLFARIVKGEEKAQWRVWENDNHVAFLTPFPNTPGFTVLAPRKHLDSNVFALEKEDFEKLMNAAYEVSGLLKDALNAESCAMILEGYEIDYAHVKLIPILNNENTLKNTEQTEFQCNYAGYVTSLDGPKANASDLKIIYNKIIT